MYDVGCSRVPVEQKPDHEHDRRACAPAEAEADAPPRPGEARTRDGVCTISSSSYARTDSSADSSDATFSPGAAVAAFSRVGVDDALSALSALAGLADIPAPERPETPLTGGDSGELYVFIDRRQCTSEPNIDQCIRNVCRGATSESTVGQDQTQERKPVQTSFAANTRSALTHGARHSSTTAQ